ncbi:MAG: exo-alpha-sialidase, partial [Planctomycetes bacterium]|nr:exo-alpha-sialidase [Planctomycetota bacterium]
MTPFPESPSKTPVFISRRDGYHAYRAPALVVSKKGTLLAFAHGRKESIHDMGNQDMVLKRSTDNGKTWLPMQILLDEGKSTVSTPAPVVDDESGRIIAVFHRNANQILTMHSDDDGLT